jgi:hypothetical protein
MSVTMSAKAADLLTEMRRAGWSVAVHNDYLLGGVPHTFWLFTHPDGRYVKGEGTSDEQAIGWAVGEAALPRRG